MLQNIPKSSLNPRIKRQTPGHPLGTLLRAGPTGGDGGIRCYSGLGLEHGGFFVVHMYTENKEQLQMYMVM